MSHFLLKLNWIPSPRKFDPLVFDYVQNQLDNFTLMMADLCQDNDLTGSRVFVLLSEIFDIYNRISCGVDEIITPDDLKKSEQLVHEIDKDRTELDSEALTVCSEAIEMESSKVLWQYLIATMHGLKGDTLFMVKNFGGATKEYIEMFKLINKYELFEILDIVWMIMDNCTKFLTVIWNNQDINVRQIDHLLQVAQYFLDNAKVESDFDGLKYQILRKYWYLIVGVNEAHFIGKSWKILEDGDTDSNESPIESTKLIELPDAPKILTHPKMTKPEDFLDRLSILEKHQEDMMKWSPLEINSEHNSYFIVKEISKYAQTAYDTIKTHHK